MNESDVEIILWDWLKTKSQYVEEVYFNRINNLGWKIFKVKGTQKKPDLIIKINDGYGIKYYAIEVKTDNNSINILNASKIMDLYFLNYIEGETQYFIDEEEIKIKGFLIASQSSLKGYLFKDEELIDNFLDKEKSKFIVATKYKIIPRYEGNRTFEFVRFLWNNFSKIRKDFIPSCSIGILIADVEDNFKPSIMITTFDNKKNRWTQRWWKI
jgi:hypothetical protein